MQGRGRGPSHLFNQAAGPVSIGHLHHLVNNTAGNLSTILHHVVSPGIMTEWTLPWTELLTFLRSSEPRLSCTLDPKTMARNALTHICSGITSNWLTWGQNLSSLFEFLLRIALYRSSLKALGCSNKTCGESNSTNCPSLNTATLSKSRIVSNR